MNKDIKKLKEYLNQTINFLKQKKVINIIIISLLLITLVSSCWIRFQNLPLLKDQTTGKYIPLALDPFYWLRIAEILEKGSLPTIDTMRYPSAHVGFSHEIMPKAVIFLYTLGKVFNKGITIQFVDVISPVIFFILGLIVFFFLVYYLTKSKIAALISSVFLSFIPSYLYRSMAGFSDHEAIGMFALFSVFLVYAIALKFLDKEHERNLLKTILFSLLIGFLSVFAIVSWGGGANFIFMILPLSFGLFWLLKVRNLNEKSSLKDFILFYVFWILSTILFGLLYGLSLNFMINKVLLSTTSILSGAVLIFIIVDYGIINLNFSEKIRLKFIKEEKIKKYHLLFSFVVFLVLASIFIWIFKGNPFSYISGVLKEVINPFAGGRTGLTVAENRQPYIQEWINEVGKYFFWVFYLGMLFVGFDISKGISKKRKALFSVAWIIMISGILFSRVSSNSLLNGENFISILFYFGGLLLFLICFLNIYTKEKIKVDSSLLFISSWLFFMLISGRGAIRLLFFVTPFVCFMAGNAIVKATEYFKRNKDELGKMFLGLLLIILISLSLLSLNIFIKSSIVQAKNTGPSANYQWQKAMEWVRENTPENSLFIHWWDYGYWIQYLGKRPTVTDGGHAIGFWDHLIGRYLLTTPKPETALSLMKSHNVSYLLIDPSDLGKYPAYSKIGSNDSWDRFSIIDVMSADRKQIRETSNGEIKVYTGVSGVDEDIVYKENETTIFLPGPTYNKIGDPSYKSFVIGVIIEFSKVGNKTAIKQPQAYFFYNNNKIPIPIRYLYFNNQLTDFGSGVEAMVVLIPSLYSSQEKIQLDQTGAAIYLSKRTMNSLFAQLYLINDAFNNYPTIKLAHSEDDPLIKNFKSQGVDIGEFIYYKGFRGPIKIWKINYPDNIISREEFLRTSGSYAEFDDLQFTK